ncbi:MAG: hypothetical protein IT428_03665 [Planctomycetaceae bacterium]|nr:hypothetical protein [Planctomycetaceae bacterium]
MKSRNLFRPLLLVLLGLLFGVGLFAAERPTGQSWRQTAVLSSPEAVQAAAATHTHVYAVTNTLVAKYERETGKRVAVSTGEAQHLNSAFLWEGRLYCAHSNYPTTPEVSQIKTLDLKTMSLTTAHNFGNAGGSLTWCVRHGEHWWCNFARYGDHNTGTFLVKFDSSFKELGRWTYPPELIRLLGRYSLSGGLWRGEDLLVTGHDDPVLFRLRLPKSGHVMEFVDRQPAPFTGQGFAADPKTGGLVGIDRSQRQIVFAQPDDSTHHAPGKVLPQPRLPRDRLLVFRGEEGRPMTVQTTDEWLKRRNEILAGMQAVMGRLPGKEKRCDLDVKVAEEVDCGRYVRRLITYAAEPGSRVPAYLCIPKAALERGGQPVRAVLCLHGTDNVVGHGVVVGLGGRPNRQYASELAERGFVTLAPNYPLLAKYQPDLKTLGWESGTLKAVWDNMRGIDLLESLPFVRKGGFGAIGHSLGGHNAVYTSVFDDRITAVVSSCGLDSYLDYYGGDDSRWVVGKGWTQPLYMPRLADYRGRLQEIPFDFHELIGALAPRHVLIIAPKKDHNFQAESVDRIVEAARQVYRLYDQPTRLRVEHPDCEHDFPNEMRESAYRLFESVLR